MWALPTLSLLNADNLIRQFDERNLWCLLLFPKADKKIADGLKANWDRFSSALGPNAHVITLLDSESPNSGKGLSFPSNYEASVGHLCRELKIRIDELPVLFLLNASDSRGPPYWSLRRADVAQGGKALETLVADICAATFDINHEMDATEWRSLAAKRLFAARSKVDTVRFVEKNIKTIQKLVPFLIRELKQHLPQQ